jgi:hypothetical protein
VFSHFHKVVYRIAIRRESLTTVATHVGVALKCQGGVCVQTYSV